jgi:ABC-type phosphate/phosphonate transport system substrate-binding protein
MKRLVIIALAAGLVVALVAVTSCRRGKSAAEMEPIVVALGPTFDPATAPKQFEPLAGYLEKEVGQPFKFQPTKSREEFASFVKDGKASFVFANPLDYFEVAEYSIVLVKANYPGKGSMVQGCIIVKEGEGVKIRAQGCVDNDRLHELARRIPLAENVLRPQRPGPGPGLRLA